MLKKAAEVVVMVVACLAASCTAATPTPTRAPETTPTPVEVLATKPEHLVGIWFDGVSYGRYEADGTITWAESIANLDIPDYCMPGKFWFADGTYYEEFPVCEGAFGCEAYLRIEEGQAVRLRLHAIEVPEQPCPDLRLGKDRILVRVD